MARRLMKTPRGLEIFVRLHELPLLIGLIITWMMLWREISLMSFVSGVVISIFLMRIFYLPPVQLAGRFNPFYAAQYLAYFLRNLALASWQVSWLAVRPGPTPKTAIIAVKLRTQSDFILTMTGLTISLIPGSLIAEADRFKSTLYLHVLNTPTERDIEHMRHEVARIERMLIMTLGSKSEIEAIKS